MSKSVNLTDDERHVLMAHRKTRSTVAKELNLSVSRVSQIMDKAVSKAWWAIRDYQVLEDRLKETQQELDRLKLLFGFDYIEKMKSDSFAMFELSESEVLRPDWSIRTYGRIADLGFTKLRDLQLVHAPQLLFVRGIGKDTVAEIRDMMEKLGLKNKLGPEHTVFDRFNGKIVCRCGDTYAERILPLSKQDQAIANFPGSIVAELLRRLTPTLPSRGVITTENIDSAIRAVTGTDKWTSKSPNRNTSQCPEEQSEPSKTDK